ncbi:MAG: hypothetical protein ACE5I2_01295 [Anaerolineae bacterium]
MPIEDAERFVDWIAIIVAVTHEAKVKESETGPYRKDDEESYDG